MGGTVLLNARIFAGAADLTGSTNRVELSCTVEEKDATTFKPSGAAAWREVLGGVASTTVSAAGTWEAGDPGMVDDALWAALNGRSRLLWTVCPAGASPGDLAYFASGLVTSYQIGDAAGEVAPWEAEAAGSGLLLRGAVAVSPGARGGDGEGDGLQLGALAAGQRLYAGLHVLSAAGTSPSLTVRVESDTDDTWGSPTTRATFNPATGAGSQVVSVTGPVTDTWWRVAWEITGTDPSFVFLVAVGIA